MERYDNYKDSGIAWLGDVPSSWHIQKLGRCASVQTGPFGSQLHNEDYVEKGTPIVTVEHFREQYLSHDNLPFVSEEDKERLSRYSLAVNDLVFSRVGSVDRSVIVTKEEDGWLFSGRCLRVRIADEHYLSPPYLNYCFATGRFKEYMRLVAVGATMPSINTNILSRIPIVVSTNEEQLAIVDYLNHHTAEIDDLLSNLQTQAAMLDTYKRELIANAITHGLDKSASFKDSGVDWIGKVPLHWEVTKTKWMFEIVKRLYGKEDRDVLSITQRGIKIRDIESNDGQLAGSYIGYQVVNVNDFAMNSMDLLTGWVDCSSFEGVTSPDYRVFRFLPSKPQCHSYYKYLFQMCYKSRIFYRLGQGVSNLGRWRLQAGQFLNMKLPQPPVDEQEQIAAYLDDKTAQVDGLITDINEQIAKLKQYRQIVIHDAVTGKIKVPGVSSNGN